MVEKFCSGRIPGSPLVVQFWELYCICNEKAKRIADVWVGNELRVTFRRTFGERLLQK
jgi:hypothetical protein